MRESQIENWFNELENRIEQLEEGGRSQENDEYELDEVKKDVQTLKMQLGKLRSRIQDVEEEVEE